MSFQITVLKVLAGHPEGRASIADLTRYVSILISSGADWTNRTKRLAARAPKLDIFGNSFVLRDNNGWQITEGGRQFLASLEAPLPISSEPAQGAEAAMTKEPPARALPPLRLVVDNEKLGSRAHGRFSSTDQGIGEALLAPVFPPQEFVDQRISGTGEGTGRFTGQSPAAKRGRASAEPRVIESQFGAP